MFLSLLFVLSTLLENCISVEVLCCSESFRSLSPLLSFFLSPLTSSLSVLLSYSIPFLAPSPCLSPFVSSLADSLAVTQTSLLLMTYPVFLTSGALASVLFLNQTLSFTDPHTHTHYWPHPSRDWMPRAAPPVSLLAACCNQS